MDEEEDLLSERFVVRKCTVIASVSKKWVDILSRKHKGHVSIKIVAHQDGGIVRGIIIGIVVDFVWS